jgi:ribosomal protein L11 methyltransferase
VSARAADAEAVLADACALLGTGCAERPDGDARVALDFWIEPRRAPEPDDLRARLADLGHAVEVTAGREHSDWQAALRAFHQPIEVAGRLRVRPPWEPPRDGLLDVEIDPAMAFGTGQHATTHACLELLAGLEPGPLLDAGTGSGVLAIAARRLGFDPVWAIDDDPLAVDAAIENARRNGVGLRVGRRRIGVDRLPQAPTVVANLTAEVLAILAEAIEPPGPRALVISGLRPFEADAAAAGFARLGLARVDARERDGWSTLLLRRGDGA